VNVHVDAAAPSGGPATINVNVKMNQQQSNLNIFPALFSYSLYNQINENNDEINIRLYSPISTSPSQTRACEPFEQQSIEHINQNETFGMIVPRGKD
jgi:hypothetical protein